MEKKKEEYSSNLTEESDDEEEHLALIVEDDKINQNYIAKALGNKGYKCKTAFTVTQALEHIDEVINNNQHFEVIFLDIILDDEQTGLDFLRIRRDRKLDEKGIVIVMTGNEELHVVQECNKYNIQNYIKKPVSASNLEYEIMRVNDEVKKQKCPIKGYKNEKKIGHGATGEVFLVRNKGTKELFAMKRVPNDDKKINTETAYHLGLKAPTILELKESRIFEGNIYMIIEYAENGTLSDWIMFQRTKNYKNYKVDPEQILLWMTELFLGLFITHEKNLIHRDIKSDNLFLCKDNILKIGDLGIAKAIEKAAYTVCGTHHYMAPEIHKKGEYDMKADIWAAGIVLYELIMLEKPFDGSSDEIIEKVLQMNYKPLPKSLDSRLHSLLKNILNYDHNARLSSKEILRLDFMHDMIKKITSENIFPIDEETLYRIAKDDSAPINVSKEKIKETIQKNEAQSKKMKQYFNYFTTTMQLDALCINKTTYQKGYFSKKFDNVVPGSDIVMAAEELNLSEVYLKELIENQFIKNVVNPNEEEVIDDEKNLYQIVLQEDPQIDNTTIVPADLVETKPKAAIKLTQDCLEMAMAIWSKIDKDDDEEEGKASILSSKDYFDFLIEIVQIKNIVFKKLSKSEKLAVILNIYQIMYLHLLIKMELYSDSNNKKSEGIVGKVRSLVFSAARKNDIIYNIGGHCMSLYELKHITIRRNKKPLDAYMRLASSGDDREKLIDGNENNKYLLICLDPPVKSIEEMSISPNFIKFSEEVTKELDEYVKEFVKANFLIDDSEISIPKFLKDYLVDFNSKEEDLVKFLLKIDGYASSKINKVLKELSNKSINITYY